MRLLVPVSPALMLGSCVTPPAAPPPAPPAAVRPAPPPPPPPSAPLAAQWEDWPFTPGDWRYSRAGADTIALFAAPDGATLLTIGCNATTRRVMIARTGGIAGGSGQMTLRTSFGTLRWPAQASPGAPPMIAVARGQGDAGLDQIAYTRGRFTVEIAGLPTLVLRAWAEPQRVIEDCRG